ncbi:hypothetical protein AMK22_20595 [Streptomyces sp. CB01580]|nr:DNA cytosine methyltransferase [Streptomyces sp. CB01580]OKJ33204.1 hypothetical protein AMK22_20595 [Streptomyces sp. CB01580]
MSNLRIGSVCSGYRGLDMAVEAVFGGTTAWVSDIDPGANRILAHHWPDVPNLGDITTTDWSAVEPVDIFCGGYPCQPFSLAGHLKGTDDERHIWPHIARALGVLRPRLAIFENVANHLRLGFADVLADLARLGFDAEWRLVRASEVGAAHQRNRLIVLAWSTDAASSGRKREGLPGWPAVRGVATADTDSVRSNRSRACGGWRNEPEARHLAPAHAAGVGEREPTNEADSVTDRGDARQVPGGRGLRTPADTGRGGRTGHGELQAGRDAVRPGVRQDADGCRTAPADADSDAVREQPVGQPRRSGTAIAELPCSVASGHAAGDGRGEGRAEPAWEQGRSDVALGGAPNWGGYGPAIARWEHVLGRPAPSPTNDLGRLNPVFVEWLMGLPTGHVTAVPDLSRTAQLKALGNGVVPQQAVAALRQLAARQEPETRLPEAA